MANKLSGKSKFEAQGWPERKKRQQQQEEYHPSPVIDIVKEYYERKKSGTVEWHDAEKAKTLNDYIQRLKQKYAKRGTPMNAHDVELLGFDEAKLKQDIICSP